MNDLIDVNTLFGPLPNASADMTIDALLELMQKHNVSAACAISTLGVLLDPMVGNAATRAACTEHPTLVPVATLNPTLFFGDSAPLDRLKAEGFRMVRFFPDLQGWPLEFAPFQALLRLMEPMELPIMVRVEKPGDITTLTRVLASYPSPIILSHVEVGLLAEAIAALRQQTHWYMEISLLLAQGALQCVAETVGAERLLFGTSAPYHPIASARKTVEHAMLSDTARQQIFALNARRLLNLNG